MPAMLPLALQRSLLEARFRLFRAALVSCLSRFPLHCLTLIRERLLRLGAHRGLLKGFRRLAGASLGVLRRLARSRDIVAEERELLPFADNESQDLLVGRFRAESTLERGLMLLLSIRDAFPKVFIVRARCMSPSHFSGIEKWEYFLQPTNGGIIAEYCNILDSQYFAI